MKISLYVCFYIKTIPENFAFLILRILELFAREVCKFLKKQVNFYHILLFLNVCKQTFHISDVRKSQKVEHFNVKLSTYYFHMKTKILADFQICISVPLRSQNTFFFEVEKYWGFFGFFYFCFFLHKTMKKL